MAVVPKGEQVPGDRLVALTPSSGFNADICVRVVGVTTYEVKGQKAPFSVFGVMAMDAAGDMVHVVENLFGQPPPRLNLIAQRKAFWMPENKPALFRLKDLKKVQHPRCNQLSCSVMQSIVVEKFGTPQASLKAVPVMFGGIEDKVLPPYYLPRRQELLGLRQLKDPSCVTICGLLTSVAPVETTSKGLVRSMAIFDGTTCLEGVKVWHDCGRRDLDATLKAGHTMVVLENFWVGISEATGTLSKCVNIPDKSKLVLMRRQDLVGEDVQWFDELQKLKPTQSISLKEDYQTGSSKPRKGMSEWAQETGTQTNALTLASRNKNHEPEDHLYVIDGALLTVDVSAETKSKKGGLFPRVLVTDHTGEVACRCGEDVLLELMGLPAGAQDELVRLLNLGPVMLRRAKIFVHRQVTADRDDPQDVWVSLVIRFGSICKTRC